MFSLLLFVCASWIQAESAMLSTSDDGSPNPDPTAVVSDRPLRKKRKNASEGGEASGGSSKKAKGALVGLCFVCVCWPFCVFSFVFLLLFQ